MNTKLLIVTKCSYCGAGYFGIHAFHKRQDPLWHNRLEIIKNKFLDDNSHL